MWFYIIVALPCVCVFFFSCFLSVAVITVHSHGSLLLSAGLISQKMNRNCQSDSALSSETREDWLLPHTYLFFSSPFLCLHVYTNLPEKQTFSFFCLTQLILWFQHVRKHFVPLLDQNITNINLRLYKYGCLILIGWCTI